MSHNLQNVKIELSIDEILLIIHCVQNSILNGKNAELAVKLIERLEKIFSGI